MYCTSEHAYYTLTFYLFALFLFITSTLACPVSMSALDRLTAAWCLLATSRFSGQQCGNVPSVYHSSIFLRASTLRSFASWCAQLACGPSFSTHLACAHQLSVQRGQAIRCYLQLVENVGMATFGGAYRPLTYIFYKKFCMHTYMQINSCNSHHACLGCLFQTHTKLLLFAVLFWGNFPALFWQVRALHPQPLLPSSY